MEKSMEYSTYTNGLKEDMLVPLHAAEVANLAQEGQKLLDSANNFVLGTVTIGYPYELFGNSNNQAVLVDNVWPHTSEVAATVMHSDYDEVWPTRQDGFRLLWWSQPHSQHEYNIWETRGRASASFIRSHVNDPYGQNNVGINASLAVRSVMEDSELFRLLHVFNELQVPRGYRWLSMVEFVGSAAVKKLFVGRPITVHMPVARTIEGTDEKLTGKIHFDPNVFRGRKIKNPRA